MDRALQRKFQKLQRQKQDVLSDLAGLSAAQLHFQPDSNSWCALDVLDHVIKTESTILAMVRQQLPNKNRVTLQNRAGAMLVNAIMRSPIRVKVPRQATMVLPSTESDLPDITANWSRTRDDIATLLESLTPEQMRIGAFRHPVAGWMNVNRTLMFLSVHLSHHVFQLERLKAASGHC